MTACSAHGAKACMIRLTSNEATSNRRAFAEGTLEMKFLPGQSAELLIA
jgi:hypothetical protein